MMPVYCPNCGAEIQDNANFCMQCGVSINAGNATTTSSDASNAAKTAATVGGVVVGAAALNSLGRRLSHRRRPMYGGPATPPPPPGRPGPGGPHGPGGPGRGGRW